MAASASAISAGYSDSRSSQTASQEPYNCDWPGGAPKESDVQVRPPSPDAVNVCAGDVRQRLDVAYEVHGQDAELSCELVGQVGEVVVVAWVQDQG